MMSDVPRGGSVGWKVARAVIRKTDSALTTRPMMLRRRLLGAGSFFFLLFPEDFALPFSAVLPANAASSPFNPSVTGWRKTRQPRSRMQERKRISGSDIVLHASYIAPTITVEPRYMRYIPNILTALRFPLTIIFLYGILQPSAAWRIAGTVCFMLSALTDLLDGILARRYGVVTEFGAFLDPLADKFQVLAGFTALLLHPGLQWGMWHTVIVVSVIVIAAREVTVTVLRSYRKKRDKPLRTSMWGKAKTMTQMLTLIVAFVLAAVTDALGATEPRLLIHLIGTGIVASALLAGVSVVVYVRQT
ncbi:hypothetical protein GF324_14500 [bacterium]|nr:hypothetical protein [bacterium]